MDRVPLMSLGDALLVSIQVDLQDDSVLALQEDLAERIVATGVRGVLIDISAVEIVDSFIGRMFASVAALSKVLDAETVVVGMRPAAGASPRTRRAGRGGGDRRGGPAGRRVHRCVAGAGWHRGADQAVALGHRAADSAAAPP